MNIVRALDVALPELPEATLRRSPPRLNPRVIAKEHVEKGKPIVIAKVPGSEVVLRFSPEQWQVVRMLDGERSFEEISLFSLEQTGIQFAPDDIREIASFLTDNTDFIYKTPIEKNIILKHQLKGQRKKRGRFHIADFTDITVMEWPRADKYVSKLYPYLKFMYKRAFVLLTLAMFTVMLWMWADKFGVIWNDSFEFYNFTAKSGRDLVEFWFLFAGMAFFHETAHGLTCKHFGGNVEKMGFTLMYFAPSFFCDASQVWIYGGKWERIATSIAGIWFDLILCFVATVVWWGTATGMWVHDFSYKVMMVTGIGVSLLNLNPLIKLDGYLIFCELIHEPDLKERCTRFLSSWTHKNIFRLPAEIEYVPRRRRAFYIVYAILSGIYGYLLLSFLMVFTYHILRSYSPEWAFIPALAIGYWVFRARIKLLVNFMKLLYLDKKERVRAWFTPVRVLMAGILALLLFVPMWSEFVESPFVLEPSQVAVLHATVPGIVTDVYTEEGQPILAGKPVVRMRNLDLASDAAATRAELQLASARDLQAQLHYNGVGAAQLARQQLEEKDRLLSQKLANLEVLAPISGIVLTRNIHDLLGQSLQEGAEIASVADVSTMRARVFVPEFSMQDVVVGSSVRLRVSGVKGLRSGKLSSLAPVSALAEYGFVPKEQLKGINPSRFYIGLVTLGNERGDLHAGAHGNAKIFVAHRSLVGFAWRFSRDLVGRRMW